MNTKYIHILLLSGAAFAFSSAHANPDATSPRNSELKTPAAAPATRTECPSTCSDARVIAVKEAKWVPGLGRGMVIVDAGKATVCNSCSNPVIASKTHDRNSNGAKSSKPVKALHDCTKSGCHENVGRAL